MFKIPPNLIPNTNKSNEKSGIGNAIQGLTSLIPFGLGGLLETFEISKNVNLVSEFGLNSWGASSSPDMAIAQFSEKAVTYVQALLGALNENNLTETLNEIEKYLTFIIELEKHKLVHHSRAASTKAGRNKVIQLATKLRNETSRTLITKLRSAGAEITQKTKFETTEEVQFIWSSTDNSFHYDKGYDYIHYTLNYPDNFLAKFNNDGTIDIKKASGTNQAMFWGIGLFALASVTGIIKMKKVGNS